jgi:outer membrane protein assembly factor BamB
MVTRSSFGEGSSPALVGGAVVVLMDQESNSSIEAVDRATGKTLWKQARDEPSTWSTPLVVTHGGRTEIVVNGTNRARSYDPADGKVLWECGGQTLNVVPTPVAGFGMVFCTSGFRGSSLQAIALGRGGDLTGTDAVRWEIKRNTPYVPSPLLYGERLYFFAVNTPRLSCVDARTGEAHFSAEEIEGLRGVYASPVGAADRVYLAGREGAVAVIRNGDRLEILALNRLEDGFDASPAIVGNDLYLRGKKNLYCFEKR